MFKMNEKVCLWDKPKNTKGFNSGINGTIINIVSPRGGIVSKTHYQVQLYTLQVKWVTAAYLTKASFNQFNVTARATKK